MKKSSLIYSALICGTLAIAPAITFAQNQRVKLVGAGAGCESFVHRPEPLDPSIASQLAAIPASQRRPPPELFAVTDKLVNATRVSCK